MTKINVAIVDDNEKMVSLLDAILQTDKDIEVIGRGDDGVQALDIIKNQEPDVVHIELLNHGSHGGIHQRLFHRVFSVSSMERARSATQ